MPEFGEDEDFLLGEDEADAEQLVRERRAIQLGADLYMLTQLQPAWNVFLAWMRRRANSIARESLRNPDPAKSHDFYLGRLEECENVVNDLVSVIGEAAQLQAAHKELAEKVRGDTGAGS